MQRALFVALDEWSTKGVEPPASRVPKLADGTLVPPLPQSAIGFPSIPGVTYTGLKTTRYLFDYGPDFYTTGIATINPPVRHAAVPGQPGATARSTRATCRRPTRDGNDIAGVRLPDVTVPLATYTGWALRAGAQANDGCEGSGPVHPVREDEGRAHGQRRSAAVGRGALSVVRHVLREGASDAIDGLVEGRLMLCEDADDAQARLLAAGLAAGVPGANGKLPPQSNVPHCHKEK